MNVLRKTNNPRLKNRRGKSYLLDFFFQKFVTHAFPLKSSYLLVPLCFEAAWQIIYLPRHEAPRLFSQWGASCEQHMWPQRPPPWLAAHLPPTCVHAPTGAYLPATDEEATSTGLPALALLQCKISGWEWCSKGSTKAAIPNLFGPRDQFCGRQFSPQTGWEMVSGWFKCIIFVVQSLSPVQPFVTPWTAASRLPCPSPTPRVSSDSCPSCQWCHPAISSSVVPFSSCFKSFRASGSFPISWVFPSGGALPQALDLGSWGPLPWKVVFQRRAPGRGRLEADLPRRILPECL